MNTRRKRLATQAQIEILELLADGGEAIRDRPWYQKNGFIIGFEATMNRLVKKGFVTIEEVGESAFAKITSAGLSALEQTLPPHRAMGR